MYVAFVVRHRERKRERDIYIYIYPNLFVYPKRGLNAQNANKLQTQNAHFTSGTHVIKA